MGRRTAPVVGAALLIVLAAQALCAVSPEIVSSDDSGIVLRYRLGDVRRDLLNIGDRQYVRLSVDGADWVATPGAPALPVVEATLAVPDCERIDVLVTTEGTSSERSAPVVPVPTDIPGPDDMTASEYREGEQYAGKGLWPPVAATVSDPHWLSRQRIVHVAIYPCQVSMESGSVVTHDVVQVSLRFSGVKPHQPPRATSARWEDVYRAAILNYDQSRAWRVGPLARTGRPDEYFDLSENWLKLTLTKRGMYRVGYEDAAAEVDPASINPATIRVFTGNGLPLPSNVDAPRPDWMQECDVRVIGGEDGTFDPGDGVIFYATGTDAWRDELALPTGIDPYYENRYTGTSVYWMTWESDETPFSGQPARMAEDDEQEDPSPVSVTDYKARLHVELNRYERYGRGDDFYMYEFKRTGSESWRSYTRLNHVVTDSTGALRARADGNSNTYFPLDHHAIFYLNDTEAYVGDWDGENILTFESRGLPIIDYQPDLPGTDYNMFEVVVPRADVNHSSDNILLDWYDIDYWRELWADADSEDETNDDMIEFGSSGRTGVLQFSVAGFSDQDVSVYKVVDRYTVRNVPGVAVAGSSPAFTAVFQDAVEDTASYIAVSDGGYLTPGVSSDARRDLRLDTNVDYVMISYDGFYEEALRLADYRRSQAGGGFNARLVRVSDIYDEFSWGLMDPTAIRDYLKYLNDNADVPPSHVLLIGDASIDYRHYLTTGIECYLPSFYTGARYFPTDVWFVGFESGEYEPGMAIGRLPVRSSAELSTITDKIERYEQETEDGVWKNTAILVGDDEWRGNQNDSDIRPTDVEYAHTEDAEKIATDVLPWPIDVRKIYLMEYDFDSAREFKPRARADLVDAWKQGSLLVNYTGHGNELLMAHELVFALDDIPRLHNLDHLPLFFAASCRLNRFDMENSDALGELLVKSPVGGTIGSIGSTRDSGSSYNSVLNRTFLSKMFGEQRTAPTVSMDVGQALQASFIACHGNASQWSNNTEFMLVGDPALTLVSPSGAGAFTQDPATLRRRDTVAVEGENAGTSGGADGIVLLRVTDSADTSGYTQPLFNRHVDYEMPGKTVFEGSSVVTGGAFSADFVVSALSEEGPHARMRAYFYGEEGDGSFSLEDVAIADSVDVSDVSGPVITLDFEGGGTAVLPGDKLNVRLYDDSGINLINRDQSDGIVLFMNTEGSEPDSIDVTDDFAFDTGSFRQGSVSYELPSLKLGRHTVTVAASDNMGNRSEKSLQFEIVSSTDFTIRNVANYPNPFSGRGGEGTRILFQLPVSADVTIDVFTVGGRRVRHIPEVPGQVGANEVYWDGLDQEGDELANGVYLYRIHAVSDEYRGDKADVIGRAVIMR